MYQTPVYGQNLNFRADSHIVGIACMVAAGQILYQIEAEDLSFNFM